MAAWTNPSERVDDPRRAERMAALLAVFYHCRARASDARPAIPLVFRLPALDEAVALLRDDGHPIAQCFRRDALTVLGEAAQKHRERPELRAALAKLAAPVRHAPGPDGGGASGADRYAEVAGFDSSVSFDPDSYVTRAEVHLRVKRSLSDLAVAFDPRCWDVEDNPFFLQTEKVDRAIFQREGRIVVDAHQPPPGSTWSGILYEDVECRYNAAALARFWNLLNVDFRTTPDSIHMRYSLFQALRSRVWFSEQRGGLDVDSGTLEAERYEPDPTFTRVVAVKSVRYSDREADDAPFEGLGGMGHFMNLMAPSIVGLWMVEQAFWGARYVFSAAALEKAFHSSADPERRRHDL
jgi:hypothetical protein